LLSTIAKAMGCLLNITSNIPCEKVFSREKKYTLSAKEVY